MAPGWQFACREEHIPEIGDHIVYDIAGRSYLVIRTAPGEIKAYPNACLHRGRQLKSYAGRCSEIRCPFHGFTWTRRPAQAGARPRGSSPTWSRRP